MSFSKFKWFACQMQNNFPLCLSYEFHILRLVSIISEFKAVLNRVCNLISCFWSFIKVLPNELTLYSIGKAVISEALPGKPIEKDSSFESPYSIVARIFPRKEGEQKWDSLELLLSYSTSYLSPLRPSLDWKAKKVEYYQVSSCCL